jgi:hypothetical protein
MDYAANSDKSKEVIQRPRGIGSKFRTIFLGGDLKEVMRHVVADVFLPGARNMIVDVGFGILERAVYGESRDRRRRPTNYGAISTVSYNNPLYRDPRHRTQAHLPDQPPRPVRDRRTVDHILLKSRDEAELVVERLGDILDKYEVVSYADLMDLVGLPVSPVDNKWGWTYLNSVQVRQVRDGYLIELPALEPI